MRVSHTTVFECWLKISDFLLLFDSICFLFFIFVNSFGGCVYVCVGAWLSWVISYLESRLKMAQNDCTPDILTYTRMRAHLQLALLFINSIFYFILSLKSIFSLLILGKSVNAQQKLNRNQQQQRAKSIFCEMVIEYFYFLLPQTKPNKYKVPYLPLSTPNLKKKHPPTHKHNEIGLTNQTEITWEASCIFVVFYCCYIVVIGSGGGGNGVVVPTSSNCSILFTQFDYCRFYLVTIKDQLAKKKKQVYDKKYDPAQTKSMPIIRWSIDFRCLFFFVVVVVEIVFKENISKSMYMFQYFNVIFFAKGFYFCVRSSDIRNCCTPFCSNAFFIRFCFNV